MNIKFYTGPIPDLAHSPYARIQDLEINIEGVRKQLANININKASGPDLIPTKILRDLASEISQMLAIYNLFLTFSIRGTKQTLQDLTHF